MLAFLPFVNRVSSRIALLAGLGLFGLASIGSGLANGLHMLVFFRGVQGLGGALLLCASLPLLAAASKPGESPTAGWAAAAALGAAIGPAAGGVLTQVFDWRAIFLAQAPAAALAAAAVWAAHIDSSHVVVERDRRRRGAVRVGTANVALALLSAGLIGALFLVVILLIDVWQLDPLGAAGVVSAIPIATYLVERAARGRSPIRLGAAGAIVLALGLVAIALLPHRQLGWMLLALLLCGAGLGLAFPTLSAAALNASGSPTVRAGRTVAARELGLVIGLLVITPAFVSDLKAVPKKAIPEVANAIISEPDPYADEDRARGATAGHLQRHSTGAAARPRPRLLRSQREGEWTRAQPACRPARQHRLDDRDQGHTRFPALPAVQRSLRAAGAPGAGARAGAGRRRPASVDEAPPPFRRERPGAGLTPAQRQFSICFVSWPLAGFEYATTESPTSAVVPPAPFVKAPIGTEPSFAAEGDAKT